MPKKGVVGVGDVCRKTVEDKRKTLIDILTVFNEYKKDDKYLSEMTLTELQNEYKRFLSHSHPHGEFALLHWTSKKS